MKKKKYFVKYKFLCTKKRNVYYAIAHTHFFRFFPFIITFKLWFWYILDLECYMIINNTQTRYYALKHKNIFKFL